MYCECEDYWKGEACNIPYCRDNCGSPDHGYCDLTGEKLCVCNDSWQGEGGGATGTGRDGSSKSPVRVSEGLMVFSQGSIIVVQLEKETKL